MIRVAALLLLATTPGWANTVEITRVCFERFCVESKEAFMRAGEDPVRQQYRLKFSRTQSVLYIQAGSAPEFPHCAPHCDTREEQGEMRSFQPRTGRLVGRLLGPLAGCGAVPPLRYHVYVYNAELNPEWVTLVPRC